MAPRNRGPQRFGAVSRIDNLDGNHGACISVRGTSCQLSEVCNVHLWDAEVGYLSIWHSFVGCSDG